MALKNKLIEKFIETVDYRNLIEDGDIIIIALSGGPDSLCLFDCLKRISESRNLRLAAVHVNHGLRGSEADADQKFVEDFCISRNVPCYVFSGDCNELAHQSGKSCEEAGRELRYSSFDQVGKTFMEGSANVSNIKSRIKIAVAHNANDQAETLLFRLMRGTGVDGLAGIEYSRLSAAGFTIIRPLLSCTRTEIEDYIEHRNLKPCIDKTNEEPIYTRNHIRLKLIPTIEKEYNPSIVESLSRLADIAQEDKDYFWHESNQLLGKATLAKSSSEIALDHAMIANVHKAIRHRTLVLAFGKIGLTADISRSHLSAADDMIENGKVGSDLHFPHNFIMTISYGKLLLRNTSVKFKTGLDSADGEASNFASYSISVMNDSDHIIAEELGEEATRRNAVIITVDGPLKELNIRLSNPPEYIGTAFQLRSRRDGDYIILKSGSELITKKIQDFFTDTKIPAHLRDQIPLLCMGREVLLILGDDITGLNTGLKKSRYTGNYR